MSIAKPDPSALDACLDQIESAETHLEHARLLLGRGKAIMEFRDQLDRALNACEKVDKNVGRTLQALKEAS